VSEKEIHVATTRGGSRIGTGGLNSEALGLKLEISGNLKLSTIDLKA